MERDIWAELPPEARAEVDALVRSDKYVHAVKVAMGGCSGLEQASALVRRRYRALGCRQYSPAGSLDADQLMAKAAALTFGAEAVEGMWDGDAEGWYVVLFAVRASPRTAVSLGVGRQGPELRTFPGEAPPWPQADEAGAVGREVAARLGVPFHFVAPDAPDDDAPRWWDTRA